jgi:hypothetical protein
MDGLSVLRLGPYPPAIPKLAICRKVVVIPKLINCHEIVLMHNAPRAIKRVAQFAGGPNRRVLLARGSWRCVRRSADREGSLLGRRHIRDSRMPSQFQQLKGDIPDKGGIVTEIASP